MSQDSQKTSAWNDYRSRRRWFFFAWFGGMPVVFLICLVLSRFVRSDIPFWLVDGGWLLFFVVAGVRLTLFRCPGCREHFFCTWFSSNQLARRCVHCGFPKWAETDSDDPTVTQ